MKKAITPILFLLIPLMTSSQITFERLFPSISTIRDISENPVDGSFVMATDSAAAHLVVLDRFGLRVNSYLPSLRLNDDPILTVTFRHTGGFVVGGKSRDTTNIVDDEPFVALLDNSGAVEQIRFLPPGDVGGSTTSLLQVPGGGYAAGVFEDQNGGSNSSEFYRFNDSLQTLWSISGGGDFLLPRSVALMQPDGFTFASYSVIGALYPNASVVDANGNRIFYSVPDTSFGGGLCFQNPVADGSPQGGAYIGATLAPNTPAYGTGYLGLLDASGQVVWDKLLDWGQNIDIESVASTADGGCILAVLLAGDLNFVRYSATGDSLWSKIYTFGGGSVSCTKFRRTRDDGFLLIGTANALSVGLVTKFDSELQILPFVGITITGNTTLCPGDTVNLAALHGYLYNWSNGSNATSIDVTQPGDYYVVIFDPGTGMTAISDTITISAYPVNTTLTASGPLEFCDGGSVELTAPAGSDYNWSNGSTIATINVDASGDFWTAYTDSNGCTVNTDTASIVEFPVPAMPTISQAGTTLFSSPGAGYQWYLNGSPISGETNQVLNPTVGGIYSVMITDGNGCTAISADFTFVFPGIADTEAAGQMTVVQQDDRNLIVRLPDVSEGVIRVIDLQGRVVFQQALNKATRLEISTLGWSTGVYQLQWINQGSSQTRRAFLR